MNATPGKKLRGYNARRVSCPKMGALNPRWICSARPCNCMIAKVAGKRCIGPPAVAVAGSGAFAECVRQVEKYVGTDDKKRQWVDSAKDGPLKAVELTKRLWERQALTIDPVPGRVAYIMHNTLPYTSGGYATRGHGMALGLQAAGLDVQCVSRPGYPGDVLPEEETWEGYPECDVIEGISYHRIFEPLRRGNSGGNYTELAIEKLTTLFRDLRPSVVMAASNYVTALPASMAARALGIPFIYEVRGFWEITRISREPEYLGTMNFQILKNYEAQTAMAADAVLTLTTPMMEELIDRGVDPAKITLAPNSCDPSRFTPRGRDVALAAHYAIPEDVPVIGYIGTFVQYEGLEHLAEACAKLKARGVKFRLLMVGNENTSGLERGPIAEEVLRIARESGLDEWLIMPGRIPHDEVEAHYSLIDVAPFPRKPQPVTEMVSPMKPLEALAMEKAVVVSSVRALTEMIKDGETGLVFEKGNVDSLAATLAQLLEDGALRARLGRTGRKWVEAERSWAKTAGIAVDVMHGVMAKGYQGVAI